MKLLLGSVLTLLTVAGSAASEVAADGAASPDVTALQLTSAVAPLPALTPTSPYPFPSAQLLSTNRADVLHLIADMRGQLADFGSLALDNGISQTADAWVDHWALAVDVNVAAQIASLQAMVSELYSPAPFLIQDFLQPPSVPVAESLFFQASFNSPVDDVPQAGFFSPVIDVSRAGFFAQ